MKKKLLILIGAALVSGSVIGAVQFFNRDVSFNANVEALSIIEEGEHGTGKCWKRTHAVENQLVLVCVSCIYIQGAPDTFFPGTDTCE